MAYVGGTEIIGVFRTGSGVTSFNGQTGAVTGVSSLNGETGAVTLVAGANITITPAGQNITIASTASGASVIASGTATLSVTAIPANTAQTVVTVAAVGVLATDSIEWAFNAIPGTGYNEGLYVLVYPSAGNVNFLVVNGTANSYTPGAAVLNWRVIR